MYYDVLYCNGIEVEDADLAYENAPSGKLSAGCMKYQRQVNVERCLMIPCHHSSNICDE